MSGEALPLRWFSRSMFLRLGAANAVQFRSLAGAPASPRVPDVVR
jgi:hypothetical protein